MSHSDQLKFVRTWKKFLPELFHGVRVLEVGSLDINGSVRPYFENADYLGIDVGEGPGVDRVVGGHELDAPDDAFDVVLSCECMEHNPYWAETIENMIRMLRPGGLLLMTFGGYGRPEHGTARAFPDVSPLTLARGWDYYGNLGRAEMRSIASLREEIRPLFLGENWKNCDFYVAGLKRDRAPREAYPALGGDSRAAFARAERQIRRWLRGKNQHPRFLARALAAGIVGEAGIVRWQKLERLLDGEASD